MPLNIRVSSYIIDCQVVVLTVLGCTLNCERKYRVKVASTALASSLSCWFLLSLVNVAELTFSRKLPWSYKAGLSTGPAQHPSASPALSPSLTTVVCNHCICLLFWTPCSWRPGGVYITCLQITAKSRQHRLAFSSGSWLKQVRDMQLNFKRLPVIPGTIFNKRHLLLLCSCPDPTFSEPNKPHTTLGTYCDVGSDSVVWEGLKTRLLELASNNVNGVGP